MTTSEPSQVTLAWLLDLEQVDRDVFVAQSPHYTGRGNLFGGQVAAQALMAAGRTVDAEHRPHSFHLYFMRAGKIGRPVVLYVTRIRDGRSFTTRNVVAQQDGEAILTMSASFHLHEPGSLSIGRPMPDVLGPEEAAPLGLRAPLVVAGLDEHRPISGNAPTELVHLPVDDQARAAGSSVRFWVRMSEPLGDDPLVHACALAYLTDGHTGTAPMVVAGRRYDEVMMTSLDHALHFHQFVRADDWLLVDSEAVAVMSSRAMCRMTLHGRDGSLAATVQQELLMRDRSADRPAPAATGTPDRL